MFGGRRISRAPLSDGTCHVQLFPQTALPARTPSRERLHLAILGDTLGKRVSANAVGRRGHFPEGRCSPVFEKGCPSGKCTERERPADFGVHVGLEALPKAGAGVQGQRRGQRRRPGQQLFGGRPQFPSGNGGCAGASIGSVLIFSIKTSMAFSSWASWPLSISAGSSSTSISGVTPSFSMVHRPSVV